MQPAAQDAIARVQKNACLRAGRRIARHQQVGIGRGAQVGAQCKPRVLRPERHVGAHRHCGAVGVHAHLNGGVRVHLHVRVGGRVARVAHQVVGDVGFHGGRAVHAHAREQRVVDHVAVHHSGRHVHHVQPHVVAGVDGTAAQRRRLGGDEPHARAVGLQGPHVAELGVLHVGLALHQRDGAAAELLCLGHQHGRLVRVGAAHHARDVDVAREEAHAAQVGPVAVLQGRAQRHQGARNGIHHGLFRLVHGVRRGRDNDAVARLPASGGGCELQRVGIHVGVKRKGAPRRDCRAHEVEVAVHGQHLVARQQGEVGPRGGRWDGNANALELRVVARAQQPQCESAGGGQRVRGLADRELPLHVHPVRRQGHGRLAVERTRR
mmetsp:Transcript_4311/g.10610  ORF Transcript_4311/g.10610 Transcript_4311/m.10610 type:complete len:379 (+) Transcript_4311:2740-3876(+)